MIADRHIWKAEEENLIRTLHGQLSRKQIQEKYFPYLTQEQIRWKMRQLKLPKAPSGLNKIHLHNQTYFENPNIENSYWAGFIAADGHIHWKGNGARLDIAVSIKDKQHILQLVKDINYTGPLHNGKSVSPSYKDRIYNNVRLALCGFSTGANDLKKNFEINSGNKTLSLQPPSNLSLELQYAYLKGFIDGDGSIGIHKDNSIRRNRVGYSLNFSIVGTYKMIEWCKDLMNTLAIYPSSNKINKKQKIWSFNWIGLDVLVVLNKLHKIKTPELERKWSNVDKYKQMVIQAYGLD